MVGDLDRWSAAFAAVFGRRNRFQISGSRRSSAGAPCVPARKSAAALACAVRRAICSSASTTRRSAFPTLERSVAFYEALGLSVAGRSLNSGIEQEQLDGVSRPEVEVTALQAEEPTPHLELLCYRSVAHRSAIALRGNDVAATRLVFEAVPPSSAIPNSQQALIDPDGHHLMIVSSVNDDAPLRCPASIEADPPSEFVKLESPR